MDEKTLLFDYPSKGVEPPVERKLKSEIEGTELYIFFSHSHADHFSSDFKKFLSYPKKTHIVLSNDISQTLITTDNESLKAKTSFTIVAPQKLYDIGSLKVRTFLSNDEGVAFLIELDQKKIYFGGDLAKWNWPEWNQKKIDEHVYLFKKTVKQLKKETIQVAFSNMDKRLPSWAGPIEFIEGVKPRYFVPMHTFGNEEWIDDLIDKDPKGTKDIFHYKKPGDQIRWTI